MSIEEEGGTERVITVGSLAIWPKTIGREIEQG